MSNDEDGLYTRTVTRRGEIPLPVTGYYTAMRLLKRGPRRRLYSGAARACWYVYDEMKLNRAWEVSSNILYMLWRKLIENWSYWM